jgi:hypothetical protein
MLNGRGRATMIADFQGTKWRWADDPALPDGGSLALISTASQPPNQRI